MKRQILSMTILLTAIMTVNLSSCKPYSDPSAIGQVDVELYGTLWIDYYDVSIKYLTPVTLHEKEEHEIHITEGLFGRGVGWQLHAHYYLYRLPEPVEMKLEFKRKDTAIPKGALFRIRIRNEYKFKYHDLERDFVEQDGYYGVLSEGAAPGEEDRALKEFLDCYRQMTIEIDQNGKTKITYPKSMFEYDMGY